MRILLVDDRYRFPPRNGGDRAVHDLSRTIEELGHTVVIRPTIDVTAGTWDLIIVSRPERAAREAVRARQASRGPTVFLGHDLHHRRLAGSHPGAAAALRSLERSCWRAYDVSLYPSDEEVTVVNNAGGRASWFPYFRVDGAPVLPWRPPDEPLLVFLGGSGHLPNLDAMSWFRDEVMPDLVAEFPNLVVAVIGQWTPEQAATFPQNTVFLGPLDTTALSTVLAHCTAFIVPLRTGAGVKSKTVDAMAAGVPLVSSPIGLQGLPAADRVCAVADTREDWVATLRRSIRKPSSAEDLVVAARGYAEARFGSRPFIHAVRRLLDGGDA